VSNNISGRHRAPGRLNPASSLSTAISRSAKPAAKASAVLVVSGGMVASFALPASAATLAVVAKAKASAAVEVQALAAPSAAQAPLVSPAFGDVGFTGVDKPKPVDRPTTNGVSRSAARVPLTTGTALDPALVSKLFGIAASLNGTPYLWGGTTPAGFDCSGFTQYVFNKIGISLPRTAEEQRQFATPVSNPQPGDLVFFGIPAYHNGIYAGNGMMWDAPKTGKTVGLHAIWAGTVTYGRVL
jgi:cell wall-associated NlpC family hydrolase